MDSWSSVSSPLPASPVVLEPPVWTTSTTVQDMLYGRGDDCAVLSNLVARARAGRSFSLVLRGEAGIGKSAVLDWLGHESAQAGMTVLRCAGVESEAGLPFASLHQLLRPAIHVMPSLPRLQQDALNGALGLSGRRGVDPFLVSVAALSMLSELAAEKPVACLVDDSQWLDPSSADVLLFVARRLEAEGIGLIFGVRDPDKASFVAPGLDVLQLKGLDDAAASALLIDRAPMVADEVRNRLLTHHAGNPLAIIELAPLLTDAQLAGRVPLPDPMPMGGEVERLYASRASELSDDSQRMLLLAATSDSSDLGLVRRAGELLNLRSDSLAEADELGLITTVRGVIRFKHPLVRSAVYQRAPFRDRQSAHRAIAGLLVDEADVDRKAWHLAHAATGKDDQVADLLEQSAARALARGGPASATDLWEWAADLSASIPAKRERLLVAAETADAAAQPERSRSLLALAEPYVESSLDRGRLNILKGAVELRHGLPETAYHLLMSAAQDLAGDDPERALDALVYAGEAATLLGQPRLTTEVGAAARTLRDRGATSQNSIDLLVGLGKLFEGDWSTGSQLLALVVDEAVDSSDYGNVLRSGRAAMYLGRLSQAHSLYARSVIVAREAAAPGQLTPVLDRLSFIELLLGRLRDAEAHALEGLRLAGELGLDAGIALTSLALVHAHRGESEKCQELAASALEVASARQLKMIGAAAQWSLGVLALGDGRPEEALTFLASVASESEGHPGILRWATPDLVEAAARARRPEVCEPALAQLEAWSTASGLDVPRTALLRCQALLADPETAVDLYERALESDARDSRPIERARIQLLLGETLRRSRHRTRSREHLRGALSGFEHLGMERWSDRARKELRASGETAARRDPTSAERLTPQELQIAQYAANGDTNAAIASKLFLSRRTVEYHLAKVYTKTGVTSRRELAGSVVSAT